LATQSSNGDSSRNGQAFNSQAYAGVSSPVWGTLTAGRQNSLLFDQGLAYDPAGGSYAFSWLGFSSTYVGGGATEDTRLDQSIKYRWAYGPVHVGALYQVGNYGNSGNSTWVHDVAQGNIGATYLGFSVDGTASKERGALNQTAASPTAAPGSGLGLTASDNTAYMATAKYKWDRFEVLGGYEWIGLANPSNPIIGLTSDSYGNPVASVTNTAYPNTRVLQFAWIGGKYQATDNLTVIASYYHVGQNSYGNGVGKTLSTSDGSAGCATNWAATCSGSIDATSLLFDYVFTKHFDTYAGVMYSKINGGLGQGYLNSWNVAPTVGARYIF
jgi:predicted porin